MSEQGKFREELELKFAELQKKKELEIAVSFYNRCDQQGFDDTKELKDLRLKREAIRQERDIFICRQRRTGIRHGPDAAVRLDAPAGRKADPSGRDIPDGAARRQPIEGSAWRCAARAPDGEA